MIPSPSATAAVRSRLANLTTSAAADALRAHDPSQLVMRGVTLRSGDGAPIVGLARTLRFLPSRSDIKNGTHGNARMALIDDANPGDVLVFGAMGYGGSVFGDMVGLRAVQTGIAGVVTDGVFRDTAALGELGLPSILAEFHRRPLRRRSCLGRATSRSLAAESSSCRAIGSSLTGTA